MAMGTVTTIRTTATMAAWSQTVPMIGGAIEICTGRTPRRLAPSAGVCHGRLPATARRRPLFAVRSAVQVLHVLPRDMARGAQVYARALADRANCVPGQ